MGIFQFFNKKEVNPLDVDYTSKAEAFEKLEDYPSAIQEYEKIIQFVYKDKPAVRYKHITKKIVDCYIKLGDYDKVIELWPSKYDPNDYGAKEMFELIKLLEAVPRNDLVLKIYDRAGKPLLRNKIEFLIKIKKIPEANSLLNELLVNVSESNPAIEQLWMTKAKLSMSLKKWDEAHRYLSKIIEKNTKNLEARKLKDFCLKQARN